MTEEQPYWEWGEIQRLAEAADIPPRNLYDVLHRRRGVSAQRARRLEELTEELFGEKFKISWETWLFSRHTTHPAFFGQPHTK